MLDAGTDISQPTQTQVTPAEPSAVAPQAEVACTIIVPCLNEEDAIAHTVEELSSVASSLADRGRVCEIIVVNDGSTDGTEAALEKAARDSEQIVRIARHMQRRGYGAALKTGLRQAQGELIIITDADGTYPNNRISDLIDRLEEGRYDMVVGARTGKNVTYSKIRAIPKIFLRRWVSFLAAQPVPDMNSGLRVFRRSVARQYVHILPDTFSFTTTITLSMLCNGHPVAWEPIDYAVRVGKSKIKPIRDTLNFMQLILRTGMYFAPLRVLLPVAIVLLLLGTGKLIYDVAVLRNVTDSSLLLLVSALNSGMFALLGDMIARVSVSQR